MIRLKRYAELGNQGVMYEAKCGGYSNQGSIHVVKGSSGHSDSRTLNEKTFNSHSKKVDKQVVGSDQRSKRYGELGNQGVIYEAKCGEYSNQGSIHEVKGSNSYSDSSTGMKKH